MSTSRGRKQLLEAIMQSDQYQTLSSRADAVLQVIGEAVGLLERIRLMKFYLTSVGLPGKRVSQIEIPKGVSYPDDQFGEIRNRVSQRTVEFVQRILADNCSPESTAEAVLEFLEKLASRDERIVSFSLVVHSVAPYVVLPDIFTHDSLLLTDEKTILRPRVVQSLAMVKRLFEIEVFRRQLRIVDMASALQYILARHRDPYELQAVLAEILFQSRSLDNRPEPIMVLKIDSKDLFEILRGHSGSPSRMQLVGPLGFYSKKKDGEPN